MKSFFINQKRSVDESGDSRLQFSELFPGLEEFSAVDESGDSRLQFSDVFPGLEEFSDIDESGDSLGDS